MYSEIYYWILYYFKKSKTNTDPEFNAMGAVAMLQIVNVATLLSALNCVLKIKVPKESMILIGIIISILILLQNYISIYKKREGIIKNYNNKEMRGKWFLWLYIIISFFLFYVFGSCVTSILSN